MTAFDPITSIFAGMTTDALQTALTTAQSAYIALASGSRYEEVSYQQGDGAKTVKYTRADITALSMLIRQLQAQLGIITAPRRALDIIF